MQQYHTHLNHVEEICKETKVNFKHFQSKAERQSKVVKQDAAREAKIISQLTEMNKELDILEEEDVTLLQIAETIQDKVTGNTRLQAFCQDQLRLGIGLFNNLNKSQSGCFSKVWLVGMK